MYTTNLLLLTTALAGLTTSQQIPSSLCDSRRQSLMTGGPTLPSALLPYATLLIPTGLSDPTATSTPPDPLGDSGYYVEALCSIAAQLPSSVLPAFSAWGSGLLSFGSVHISEFDAYVTECVTTGEAAVTAVSSLNALLTGTGSLCPQGGAVTSTGGASNGTAVSSSTVTPAPTATGANSTLSSGSSSAATSVVTAAAVRPTGVFVSAVAIGGLIGAAAIML